MLEENDEHATDICYNHPTPQENKDCKPPKKEKKMGLQQTNDTNRITAIYLRLSNDESAENESNSIVNQRKMLSDYVNEQGFRNVHEFCDDGWSGTEFNHRPDFQNMISMVKDDKIGIVIVKDLSRLGREHIQLGIITEFVFPEHNVRFIALQDGIDSSKDEETFMPFRSILKSIRW